MKVLLVDGPYYVYRSFFAIRDLRNARGEPTNAVFGFAKTIRRMLKDLKPDLAAVCWDMGLPEHRLALQPAYKQQRPEMPLEMRPQIDLIRNRLLPAFGIHCVAQEGTEADDWIACYTGEAIRAGVEVVIATNDKDIFQLVGDTVRIYSTTKQDLPASGDSYVLLDEARVLEKWGVPPSQIGEVLSLTGDSSDNIPGVPGFGVKTAVAVLREAGGLEAILANPERVKNERLRNSIQASRELIIQNRSMVKLDSSLSLPIPLRDLLIKPDDQAAIELMDECSFRSLAAEVRSEAESKAPAVQGELF